MRKAEKIRGEMGRNFCEMPKTLEGGVAGVTVNDFIKGKMTIFLCRGYCSVKTTCIQQKKRP
jgi:hypothetical protein